MKAGFIGAGRVGFSLGKYLSNHQVTVSGYYDHSPEHAAQAAEFTGSKAFGTPGELAKVSDILFLTTPDGVIRDAWETIRGDAAGAVRDTCAAQDDTDGPDQNPGTTWGGTDWSDQNPGTTWGDTDGSDQNPGITWGDTDGSARNACVIQKDSVRNAAYGVQASPLSGKIICHCSGSLTSEVFEGIRATGAVGCSLHPMLAFSDRYTSYRQLENAFFTIEGDESAVAQVTELFETLGNRVCPIKAGNKALYHTAASVLSNQVVAVLDTGYRLLVQCGFSEADARKATEQLVRGNVEHVIRDGCVEALTGPIERGDVETVRKHLDCLEGEDREMYHVLGRKLTEIARVKHPEKDYGGMESLLK